ncbi:MAG TPA: ABC transporter permease [Gaiellaceae bacterium]|jgi:peptide/nickel transport system permease protein
MRRLAYFLTRRLVASVFTLLLVITLTFVLFWAIPATPPAQYLYPFAQHLSNYQIQRGNHVFGLDKPKYVQWAKYVEHLAEGDFGKDWNGTHINADQSVTQVPINDRIIRETRITLSLLLGGAALVLLLALPLGAFAARYAGSIGDRLIGFLTLIAICTHPMVIGLILRTFFGDQHKWLPDGGYCTFGHHAVPISSSFNPFFSSASPSACAGGPWPWFEHLILPWVSFALLFLALYTRMARASVLEVMHDDFVRTARSKGAGEPRVIGRHVLPYAGLRILTMIGMEIGTAIGIAVYIEAAFGLHGLATDAVFTFAGSSVLDLPVVLGIVTMITLIVIVGNLLVDVLYAIIDPRVGSVTRTRSTAGIEPVVV